MQRPSPLLLAAMALCSVLVGLGWWWPNRPQAGDVAMAAPMFNSVSFAPFRRGQSPLTDSFPTAAEAEADIALVATRARAIRTYAANEGEYDVAAMARRHGLKLWLGIWLGADRASNEREMARGIAIARANPDVVDRIIVGNEVLLRRDLPVAELIADIDRVRAAGGRPVTYADVWEFWTQFPEIAPHVDMVTIHLLPYWEDQPTGIDRAVAHVDDIYARIAALFPGKRIAIGETGWPSRGRPREDAAPGVVAQALFLRRFIARAVVEGFDYNLIEAFDQEWKYKNEGIVGANWGLWTMDRTPKFPLAGPVVENPAWRLDAVASVVVAVLLAAFGLAGPSLTARRQATLGILAAALGAALGYAGAATAPDLYDVHQRIAAVVNLAAQAVLAVLLIRRAALLLAGQPPGAARTGADATRRVVAMLRLRRPGRDGWFDDLSFLFAWTAMVLESLLLFDPRYRDFPFAAFAVPLVAVIARALLSDLPRVGGGREELAVGAVLAAAAVASGIVEGGRNGQAMGWTACALVLAAPPLLRVLRRAQVDLPTG